MAILGILSFVFLLAGFVGWIIIMIAAFKESAGQGLLCLCIPFYIFYFAFAKFENEKKGLIIAIFLGGYIIGMILQVMAAAAAVAAAAGAAGGM